MSCKSPKYWETHDIKTTTEWSKMPVDWLNEYKIINSVYSYFFRYDNYIKGLKNEHIMLSTFGRKELKEIQDEIDWWFERCIGAYNTIIYYK